MGVIASQITSLTIVYSTIYSDADQRKHQSSASLSFVRGIHRGPVNSPDQWPVTRKMFPFDDVIMSVKMNTHFCHIVTYNHFTIIVAMMIIVVIQSKCKILFVEEAKMSPVKWRPICLGLNVSASSNGCTISRDHLRHFEWRHRSLMTMLNHWYPEKPGSKQTQFFI